MPPSMYTGYVLSLGLLSLASASQYPRQAVNVTGFAVPIVESDGAVAPVVLFATGTESVAATDLTAVIQAETDSSSVASTPTSAPAAAPAATSDATPSSAPVSTPEAPNVPAAEPTSTESLGLINPSSSIPSAPFSLSTPTPVAPPTSTPPVQMTQNTGPPPAPFPTTTPTPTPTPTPSAIPTPSSSSTPAPPPPPPSSSSSAPPPPPPSTSSSFIAPPPTSSFVQLPIITTIRTTSVVSAPGTSSTRVATTIATLTYVPTPFPTNAAAKPTGRVWPIVAAGVLGAALI